jgi:nucleoside diphosphate kinase
MTKPLLKKLQQSPTTMEIKQALAQLIDAYADAKASKNQILLQYATQELQNFIQGVDIVQTAQTDETPQVPSYED